VVIGVDAAEALLFAEMISYIIASRPFTYPGAGRDDHECAGQVSSFLPSWDLAAPSPDTAEAERPIMRNSLAPPSATLGPSLT
jgi:hypothetical protein